MSRVSTVNQVRNLVEAYVSKIKDRTAKDAEYKLIKFAESLAFMAGLKKSTCVKIAIEVFNR